ncbi:MAG: NYN domain-containing protein [archaeon]
MKKAIVFVDANNWYHNVKRYYTPSEVDIIKIADFIKNTKDYSIIEIRWYTSIPSIEDGEKMYFQHLSFISHLKNQGIKVIERKLQRIPNKEILKKRRELLDSLDLCKVCKPIVDAQFLEIADIRKKEKGIDVWIAVDMINKSVITKECDVCVLISGDADFVPAFELIRVNGKEVLSSAVPWGYSSELRAKFPYLILNPDILKKCFRDYESKKRKE